MEKCTKCGKECKNHIGRIAHERYCKVSEQVAQPVVQSEQPVRNIVEPVFQYNTSKYKELPKNLIDFLERTYGNWLNYFEIGQMWREDYGGYGVYVKIPKQFSTEWQEIQSPIYDNDIRKLIGQKKVVIEDLRSMPMKDIPSVTGWLERIKKSVIESAYRKGFRLPNTATGIDETRQTLEVYEKAIVS